MQRRSLAAVAITGLVSLAAFVMVESRPARADNSMWGASYFPNVTVTTQDGTQVKFYDDLLKNKMFVINLIYTHCSDSCPLETAKLKQVYNMLESRMGKDLYFYSITVDPKRDTPEVLKNYTEKFHTGPGWYFLTGKKEDLDAIRKKLGIALRPNSDPLSGHSTTLIIGNEATGQYILDSSMDDPHYIATILGDWMSSWKYAKVGKTYAERPEMDRLEFEKGGTLFRTTCAACHTVGKGDNIGPDLAGVTRVRDRKWLARFIMEPDKMLSEKDPIATALYKKYNEIAMPSLKLSDQDAQTLVSFLEARDKEMDREHGSEVAPKDSPKISSGSSR